VTFPQVEAAGPYAYKVTSQQERQAKMTDQNTTHFGFQTVPEADKAGMVHGVFKIHRSAFKAINLIQSNTR
jgi:hypothetical protein